VVISVVRVGKEEVIHKMIKIAKTEEEVAMMKIPKNVLRAQTKRKNDLDQDQQKKKLKKESKRDGTKLVVLDIKDSAKDTKDLKLNQEKDTRHD